MISKPGPNLSRSLRLMVAMLGGYFFAVGFVAALPNFEMARTESATLSGMLHAGLSRHHYLGCDQHQANPRGDHHFHHSDYHDWYRPMKVMG